MKVRRIMAVQKATLIRRSALSVAKNPEKSRLERGLDPVLCPPWKLVKYEFESYPVRSELK